jgi:hypothetical protein
VEIIGGKQGSRHRSFLLQEAGFLAARRVASGWLKRLSSQQDALQNPPVKNAKFVDRSTTNRFRQANCSLRDDPEFLRNFSVRQ